MTRLPRTVGSRVLLLVLIFLAAYGQFQTWSSAAATWPHPDSRGVGMDFYQFRFVPFTARKYGMVNLYSGFNRRSIGQYSKYHVIDEEISPQERAAGSSNAATYRGSMGVAGTPFFYALFGFLQSEDYDSDLRFFRLASLFVSELTILLLCAALSFSLARTVAVFALFSYWFKPFGCLLEVANVNHLQIGLLVLCALCTGLRSKVFAPAMAGAVMSIALLFKPNPIFSAGLLCVVYFARRDLKGLTIAFVAAILVAIPAVHWSSSYFGGTECWVSWASRTSNALRANNGWNLSLVSSFKEWSGVNVELIVLGVSMLIACALISLPKGLVRTGNSGPPHEFERTLLVISTGLMVPLVGFRIVWEHHFALAVPLILYLLRPAADRQRGRWRLLFTALAVALIFDIPEFLFMPRVPAVDIALFGSGGVILLVLCFLELARPRSQSRAVLE